MTYVNRNLITALAAAAVISLAGAAQAQTYVGPFGTNNTPSDLRVEAEANVNAPATYGSRWSGAYNANARMMSRNERFNASDWRVRAESNPNWAPAWVTPHRGVAINNELNIRDAEIMNDIYTY